MLLRQGDPSDALYILLRGRDWPGRYQGADYAQPFRSGALVLWSGKALAAWLGAGGASGS